MPDFFLSFILTLTAFHVAASITDARLKLVCSQPDSTFESVRGYCTLSDDKECTCTDDCTQNKSLLTNECVCASDDLIYAQKHRLTHCTIWTQHQWKNHIKSSRRFEEYYSNPPASNTPDGQGLLFSTRDQGLAWPITDARDRGNLLPHGPHCLHMLEEFNEQILRHNKLNNSVDRSHYNHCRRLALRVLAYYENDEPNYHVTPKSVCSSLFPLSKRHLNSVSDKVTYTESYKLVAKQNNGMMAPDLISPQDIYDGLVEDVAKQNGKTRKKTIQMPSQQKLLERISGQNLGNLILKDWLEEELTPIEESFLRNWDSEYVIHIAALGIFCIQGHGKEVPVDHIRSLLTRK